MTYGGRYPVGNIFRDWTSDWREYQYQCYQRSLEKEEEDVLSDDELDDCVVGETDE